MIRKMCCTLMLIVTCILNCAAETMHPVGIGKNADYLTFDGNEWRIKSIYLLAWLPGENPAYGEQPLAADYNAIMDDILATGANTVSVLHALMPAEFYKQSRAHGLKIIQGVWFDQGPADFQNAAFKTSVKTDIKNMIDNFHNRDAVDYSADILFLNIGNEFVENSVIATDAAHPEIASYSGIYISAPVGSKATECFLAEICDYAVTYEINTYGVRHYVSHSTWSPVSPALMEPSFLDIISYNVYSYWPDWMLTYPGGSTTGTPYQGYIETMKQRYLSKPFYISEFGYSTAPLKPDTACVSEQEQADGIKARWQDITTASYKIAGAAVFNYQDEWWPQANTASWPAVSDENEHAQDDREEWFGIIKIDGSSNTNYSITKKPAYYAVQEMYTAVPSSSTTGGTASSSFRIYPNPCRRKEQAMINFSGLTGKDTLEIFNLAGELVYSASLNTDTTHWDLDNIYGRQVAAGIYIVKASGPDGTAVQKIALLP